MNQVPSDFRAAVPKLAENATDEDLEAWLQALPPCPGLPSTDAEVAAADARARADVAAGRVHDHTVVSEWLGTWGTADHRSFKEWLNARDG